MNSTKNAKLLHYMTPVVGLGTANFYRIHYLAITCLVCSLTSVIAILAVSFRSKRVCSFYKSWTKCERFVVYMALCDGFYSVVHLMDHIQVAITQSHVHPLELCEVYGFVIFMFASAQMLLTSLIAINAFALIKFGKKVNLGRYDWRLLLLTYGVPIIECLGIILAGDMGPTGISCGVAGKFSFLCLSTIPILAVMTLNIILYSLTWYTIRAETKRLSGTIGNKNDRPTRAARTMSLFVLVFIIQWGAAAVYGAWTMLDDHIPLEIVFPVMTFSSLGGLLNGIVYLNMRIKSKRWNTTTNVNMISTKQTIATPFGDPGTLRHSP